jgi:hypothetical protein
MARASERPTLGIGWRAELPISKDIFSKVVDLHRAEKSLLLD